MAHWATDRAEKDLMAMPEVRRPNLTDGGPCRCATPTSPLAGAGGIA
jgi:hypothetical protein